MQGNSYICVMCCSLQQYTLNYGINQEVGTQFAEVLIWQAVDISSV
jgi:hypothetical protein